MSRITNSIFKNLKEAEKKEVKKPYGDKPEEGKKIAAPSRKKASVPKAKGNIEKYKALKLQNNNKQAADIYASDTDKVMDKIDSKEQSDKGKIAKQNTTKASREIKKPYGDKIQPSTSKLVKEAIANKKRRAALKESMKHRANARKLKENKALKEDGNYSYGSGLLKEIYKQYVGFGMEDEFFEDCYNKMDISEEELKEWLQLGECDKPKNTKEECDKPKPAKK